MPSCPKPKPLESKPLLDVPAVARFVTADLIPWAKSVNASLNCLVNKTVAMPTTVGGGTTPPGGGGPGTGTNPGWDDTLLVDNHSGFRNPVVDVPQYILWGRVDQAPASGHMRLALNATTQDQTVIAALASDSTTTSALLSYARASDTLAVGNAGSLQQLNLLSDDAILIANDATSGGLLFIDAGGDLRQDADGDWDVNISGDAHLQVGGDVLIEGDTLTNLLQFDAGTDALIMGSSGVSSHTLLSAGHVFSAPSLATRIQSAFSWENTYEETGTGTFNDYDAGGNLDTITTVILTGNGGTITGLDVTIPGKKVLFINGSESTWSFPHANSGSASANQFAFPAAATINLAHDETLLVIYDDEDPIQDRWKAIGGTYGGGAGGGSLQSWAQVLVVGNASGGTDPVVSTGDSLAFGDGTQPTTGTVTFDGDHTFVGIASDASDSILWSYDTSADTLAVGNLGDLAQLNLLSGTSVLIAADGATGTLFIDAADVLRLDADDTLDVNAATLDADISTAISLVGAGVNVLDWTAAGGVVLLGDTSTGATNVEGGTVSVDSVASIALNAGSIIQANGTTEIEFNAPLLDANVDNLDADATTSLSLAGAGGSILDWTLAGGVVQLGNTSTNSTNVEGGVISLDSVASVAINAGTVVSVQPTGNLVLKAFTGILRADSGVVSVDTDVSDAVGAFTGAISKAAGATTTQFAGIRQEGIDLNDRTNLNLISTTSIIAAPADDAINDEIEIAFERAALTGDVTAAQNSNTTTIANGVVTNAKLLDMPESRVKGRAVGAGTGSPQDLTSAQLAAVLSNQSTLSLAPSSELDVTTTTLDVNVTTFDVAATTITAGASGTTGISAGTSLSLVSGGETDQTIGGLWDVNVTGDADLDVTGSYALDAAGIVLTSTGTSSIQVIAGGALSLSSGGGGDISIVCSDDTFIYGDVDSRVCIGIDTAVTSATPLVDTFILKTDNDIFFIPGDDLFFRNGSNTDVARFDGGTDSWLFFPSGDVELLPEGDLTLGDAGTDSIVIRAATDIVIGNNADAGSNIQLGTQLLVRSIITPTTLSASVNDWNPTGLATANIIRINVTGANRTITGIVAQPNGTVLRLYNVSQGSDSDRAFILSASDTGSSANNRFRIRDNKTVSPGEGIEIWYDGTSGGGGTSSVDIGLGWRISSLGIT